MLPGCHPRGERPIMLVYVRLQMFAQPVREEPLLVCLEGPEDVVAGRMSLICCGSGCFDLFFLLSLKSLQFQKAS